MPFTTHGVLIDAETNALAHAQAKKLGLTKTRYLESLIEDLAAAAPAKPTERRMTMTRLQLRDDVWSAVQAETRANGRTISSVLIDEINARGLSS